MTTAQQPAPVPPEPHGQTPQPKSPDQHTVRKQLTSGVFYIAIAKYAGIVISLAVSGVLARLLSPSDFGIVAVATVIITFFSIFSDLGIAPAIIQYKKLTGEELNGIFSFTIWSGLAVSLLFFGSSWLIASYYDSPQLVRICQFLSVNLLFAAMNIVPNALLYKQKRFRFIAMRNLCVQGSVGTIAVIAALSGAGIYALLINPIVSSIVLFIVNLREHPLRVRWTAGLQPLRTIFAFSAYQFSFNVINYFTRNLDKLLIGKYMGMSPLGFYEKSYRLMMLPLQNITNIISPVMHPIFSDFQHDLRKLSESYLKVVRVLAWIGFPLAAVLYFTAPELILLIFGSQWEASVPVFRILALSVGVQVVMSTSGSIFQAAGSTHILFLSGLLSALLNAGGICLGIFGFRSLDAVAWCICISFSVNFVQAYWLMYYRTFRLPWGPFWRKLASPLLLGVLLWSILWGFDRILPARELFFTLIAKGVLSLVIWGGYLQLTGEFNILGRLSALSGKFFKR